MPFYSDMYSYGSPTSFSPAHYSAMLYLGSSSSLYSGRLGSPPSSRLPLPSAPRLLPPPVSRRPRRYAPPSLPTISETARSSIISSSPRPLSHYIVPRPIRIDTADIDVTSPRRSDPIHRSPDITIERKESPKERVCTIKRGRTVVRLHTRILKERPPSAINATAKTKGERLAEKFYMHQSPSRESPVRAKQNESATQERLEEIMSRERPEDSGSKELKDVSVKKSSESLAEVKATDKIAEQFKPSKDVVDSKDKETEKTQIKAEGKVKRKLVQGSDESKQIATKIKIENKLRLIKVEDLEKPQVAIVAATLQTDVKSDSTTGRLDEKSKIISETIESAPVKTVEPLLFPVSDSKDKVPRMVVSDVSIEVKHARLPPKLKPAKRLLLQVEIVVDGEESTKEAPKCVPSSPSTPKTPTHSLPFHSPADAEKDKFTPTKSSGTVSASTDSVNGKKSGDMKGKQRRKGDTNEVTVQKTNVSSATVLKNQAKIPETCCDTVSEKDEGTKVSTPESDTRVAEEKGISHPRNVIPKGSQPVKLEGKAESNLTRNVEEAKDVIRTPGRQVSNLESMEKNSKDVKRVAAAPSQTNVRTLTPAATDKKNTASTESTEETKYTTARTIPSSKAVEKFLPKDSSQTVSSQARIIKGKQQDANQTPEINAVKSSDRSADEVNAKSVTLVISNKSLSAEEAKASATNQESKFSRPQPGKIDNDKGVSIPKNIEIKKLKVDSLADEERGNSEKKELAVTLDSTISFPAKSETEKKKPEGREGLKTPAKTEVPSTIVPLEKAKVDRKDDMKLKEVQSLGKLKEKPDQVVHDKLSMTEAKDKENKTADSLTRPEPLHKQAEKPLELASRLAVKAKDQLKEPLKKSTAPDTTKGKLENQTSKPMFGTKSQPKDARQISGPQEPPEAEDKPQGLCDKISPALPEYRVENSKTLGEIKNGDKKPIPSDEKSKNAKDATENLSESPTAQSPTTKLGKQAALGMKPSPDCHDWIKFQLHSNAEHPTTAAAQKTGEKLKSSEATTKDAKCLPKEPVGKTSKTPGKVTDSPVLGLKNKKDATKGTPEKQTPKKPENKTPERPVSIQSPVSDKKKSQDDKPKTLELPLSKPVVPVPLDVSSNVKVPLKSCPVDQPKLKRQAKSSGTGISLPEGVPAEKKELKSIPKLPKNNKASGDTSEKVFTVEKPSAKALVDMKNEVEVGVKIGESNKSNPMLEPRDTGECEQLASKEKLDEPRLGKLRDDSGECRGPSAGRKTEEEESEESSEESSEEESTTEEETEDELEQQLIKEVIARASKPGTSAAPAKSLPRYRDYNIEDFLFLKVLGKGSFGKVFLASLRREDRYYAVKCLKKQSVIEEDDVECTLIERKVLSLATAHPYLCHLFCTFQTESHLFFVMEYLNGGDLMFHIQRTGRFEQDRARFYAAEIVSGLKFLHKKGIIYRDLKLDNILLDYDGHVRIADFGMCKLQIFLDRTADTFCGTPDYIAPEIIKGYRYNQTVDWWSFGVLLYEMLVGQSPFTGCDEDELFWCICNENPLFPRFLSDEACDILAKLLNKDSDRRMGAHGCHAGDITDQAFFRPIDWWRLERRELEPPFRPALKHPLDLQYFDTSFTYEKAKLTPVNKHSLPPEEQLQFDGFSYTNPNATD